MSIKAMKLALSTLEDVFGKNKIDIPAITILRSEIAEAEKKNPVAWRWAPSKVWKDYVFSDDEDLVKVALECGISVDALYL